MNLPTFSERDVLNKFIRLRKSTSTTLKENFHQAFCDVKSHRYQKYLTSGNFPTWTAMPFKWGLVTKEDLLNSPPFTGNVYVGWDYEDYYVEMYGIGKFYLFKMPLTKFMSHYESFPVNTYVFVDNFDLALVSTVLEFSNYIRKMRLYTRANEESNL